MTAFLLGLACGVALTLGAITWLGQALRRSPQPKEAPAARSGGRAGERA